MFSDVLDKLNDTGIYLQSVKSYLDINSLKRVSGTTNSRNVLDVCVDEEGRCKGLSSHNSIYFKKSYIDFWGVDRSVLYGNVVIVCSDDLYNSIIADDKIDSCFKITDIDDIVF